MYASETSMSGQEEGACKVASSLQHHRSHLSMRDWEIRAPSILCILASTQNAVVIVHSVCKRTSPCCPPE
eukprot:747874-Hanusia_phi.AAC.1